MAAGIHYKDNSFEVERELYSVKTGYRMIGGFNPTENTMSVYKGVVLPTLCPIIIDTKAHTFEVVSNIKVLEEAAAGATSVKIAKKSIAKVGEGYAVEGKTDTGLVITAIDASNDEYDLLTVDALAKKISAGVLVKATVSGDSTKTYKAGAGANALLYTRTKMEEGCSITALGQAYEIKEDELYVPVSTADKTALTSRFMFV